MLDIYGGTKRDGEIEHPFKSGSSIEEQGTGAYFEKEEDLYS